MSSDKKMLWRVKGDDPTSRAHVIVEPIYRDTGKGRPDGVEDIVLWNDPVTTMKQVSASHHFDKNSREHPL
jgi:hypothetical protein